MRFQVCRYHPPAEPALIGFETEPSPKKAGLAAANREPAKPEAKSGQRDWIVFWTAVSGFGALVAAIFAGWSAFENAGVVFEAGRATKAAVWLQVLAEYEKPEMLIALKELRQFQSDNKNFDQKFHDMLVAKTLSVTDREEMSRIDNDRRFVLKFFDKLRILSEENIVENIFIRKNWDSGTFTYLSDVVAPLHRAKLQAMLETKATTPKDNEAATKVLANILNFYKNVVVDGAAAAHPFVRPR